MPPIRVQCARAGRTSAVQRGWLSVRYGLAVIVAMVGVVSVAGGAVSPRRGHVETLRVWYYRGPVEGPIRGYGYHYEVSGPVAGLTVKIPLVIGDSARDFAGAVGFYSDRGRINRCQTGTDEWAHVAAPQLSTQERSVFKRLRARRFPMRLLVFGFPSLERAWRWSHTYIERLPNGRSLSVSQVGVQLATPLGQPGVPALSIVLIKRWDTHDPNCPHVAQEAIRRMLHAARQAQIAH